MDPVNRILGGEEFVLLKRRVIKGAYAPSGIKYMDTIYELYFIPRFNKYKVIYSQGGYGGDSASFKNKSDAIKAFNKGI